MPLTEEPPGLGVASRSSPSMLPRRGSGPEEARAPASRRSA